MDTLMQLEPEVEVYSIDEAFIVAAAGADMLTSTVMPMR